MSRPLQCSSNNLLWTPAYAGVVMSGLLFLLTACHRQPTVQIATVGNDTISFQVEIADTAASREQGLQYRTKLSEHEGMLFIFPGEAVQTFWMKNTPIPLDMIFIDSRKKIVGIVTGAIPFSLTPLSVDTPSQYVLEIAGGMAAQQGIHSGDTVRFNF